MENCLFALVGCQIELVVEEGGSDRACIFRSNSFVCPLIIASLPSFVQGAFNLLTGSMFDNCRGCSVAFWNEVGVTTGVLLHVNWGLFEFKPAGTVTFNAHNNLFEMLKLQNAAFQLESLS